MEINEIPEFFLLNAQKTEKENKVYYNASNNKDILSFYNDFCNSKNLNIYYRDNSLIKDMYALSVYIPELNMLNYKIEHFKNMSDDTINNNFITLKYGMMFLDKLFDKSNLNFTSAIFYELNELYSQINSYLFDFNWIKYYQDTNFNIEELKAYFNPTKKLIDEKHSSIIKEINFINNYKESNYELLIQLLTKIFNKEVEEIQQLMIYGSKKPFLFFTLFLKEYLNNFYSPIFEQYIKSYCQ